MKSKTILISSCLLGIPCRWHGKKCKSGFVAKYLATHKTMEVITVCPEMLGGLPVPRPPVKRVKGKVYETCADKENRKNVTGQEVTSFFTKGARATLRLAKKYEAKKAILCKWSPSCDKTGITGKLLLENGIKVINTF